MACGSAIKIIFWLETTTSFFFFFTEHTKSIARRSSVIKKHIYKDTTYLSESNPGFKKKKIQMYKQKRMVVEKCVAERPTAAHQRYQFWSL